LAAQENDFIYLQKILKQELAPCLIELNWLLRYLGA